ncbi:uncharacterized protein BDZ99DRAFT_355730, partial [Mytilinidion resinicola]
SYRLLLIDSYISYLFLEFITKYKEARIILFYLPPYTTYNIQPLDYYLFSILKKQY